MPSTHVHFDHTGGNFRFSGPNAAGCKGICMGGADQTFSRNCKINSLCMAHSATIRDFEVTRWLAEGDLIYLNDANPTREEALEVINTPGHTTDSIALYYPAEKKLFVGDTLYPFTAIHLDCLGSNVIQYVNTLNKLVAFIEHQKSAPASAAAAAAPAPAPVVAPPTPADPLAPLVADFLAFTGLDASLSKQFSIHSLLELCDKNLERAVDMYLSSPDDVRQMCPPTAAPSQVKPAASAPSASSSGIVLCCGHVEAALNPSALQEMQGVMAAIRAKAISPLRVDDGYGEYNYGNFTVMVSLNAKWE